MTRLPNRQLCKFSAWTSYVLWCFDIRVNQGQRERSDTDKKARPGQTKLLKKPLKDNVTFTATTIVAAGHCLSFIKTLTYFMQSEQTYNKDNSRC